MLERAIRVLRRVQAENVAIMAEYTPAAGAAREVCAVMGRTSFRAADESGIWTRVEMRDFIVPSSQLDAEPEPGDEIAWNGRVYQVLAPAGEPAWVWSDTFNTAYRIHTKHIGEA